MSSEHDTGHAEMENQERGQSRPRRAGRVTAFSLQEPVKREKNPKPEQAPN